MGKTISSIIMICMFVFSIGTVFAKQDSCTTIQSGEITDINGDPISTGYDMWGYNYQAHMFNGLYCNYDRDDSDCLAEGNDLLSMKWNDAWLSNKDCDGDYKLDRHYGYDSYIGSGAWLTNHMNGTYTQDNETCNWNYFVKIVAVPEDATLENSTWYSADGGEIGPVIWGEFAIIQEISYDPCQGEDGILYKSPLGPGLGKY